MKRTVLFTSDGFTIHLTRTEFGNYFLLEYSNDFYSPIKDASFGRLLQRAGTSEHRAKEVILEVFGKNSEAMSDYYLAAPVISNKNK